MGVDGIEQWLSRAFHVSGLRYISRTLALGKYLDHGSDAICCFLFRNAHTRAGCKTRHTFLHIYYAARFHAGTFGRRKNNPESQFFTIGMYFWAPLSCLMFEGTNLPTHGSDGVTPVTSAVRACDR